MFFSLSFLFHSATFQDLHPENWMGGEVLGFPGK